MQNKKTPVGRGEYYRGIRTGNAALESLRAAFAEIDASRPQRDLRLWPVRGEAAAPVPSFLRSGRGLAGDIGRNVLRVHAAAEHHFFGKRFSHSAL